MLAGICLLTVGAFAFAGDNNNTDAPSNASEVMTVGTKAEVAAMQANPSASSTLTLDEEKTIRRNKRLSPEEMVQLIRAKSGVTLQNINQ